MHEQSLVDSSVQRDENKAAPQITNFNKQLQLHRNNNNTGDDAQDLLLNGIALITIWW